VYWNPVKYKEKKVNRQYGDGVNSYLPPMSVKESELTDSLNMSGDDWPEIRTRNDRTVLNLPAFSSTLNAFGQRNNQHIHVLDGPDWKYALPGSTAWINISTAMANSDGVFLEFNTEAARYTILANADTTEINQAYDGTTTLVSLTSDAPHTDLYTVHKYRLYAIDGRTLKHSAQGSITDWITSLDAGTIDLTNAKGPGKAIRTYADHVIVWTENSMHELWGTEPLNYSLVDVSNEIGCVDKRAHVECNGKLYWMDYKGIYLYTGGIPQLISDKVKKWIDGINWTYKYLICAGSKGNKVRFAIPYKSTAVNMILVYDTVKGIWSIEDGDWTAFENVSGTLYGLNSDGRIWNMESTYLTGKDNSTAIPWNIETKAYNDFALDSQTGIKDMWTVYSGTTDATMAINYTTNVYSTTYSSLVPSSDITFSAEPTKQQTLIPLNKLQNVDWYKLQFKGTGFARLHGVQLNTLTYGG
jgi:hypothetical protein